MTLKAFISENKHKLQWLLPPSQAICLLWLMPVIIPELIWNLYRPDSSTTSQNPKHNTLRRIQMLSRCWINSPPLHLPECEWSSSPSGRSSVLVFSASWTDYSSRTLCDLGISAQMDDRTGVRLAPSLHTRDFPRILLMLHRYVLTPSVSNGHDCVRSHDFLSPCLPSQPLPL